MQVVEELDDGLPVALLPHTMVYVIVPTSEARHIMQQFPYGDGDRVHSSIPIKAAFLKSTRIHFYISDWHIREAQYLFLLAIRISLQGTPYQDTFRMWTGPAPKPKRQRHKR